MRGEDREGQKILKDSTCLRTDDLRRLFVFSGGRGGEARQEVKKGGKRNREKRGRKRERKSHVGKYVQGQETQNQP